MNPPLKSPSFTPPKNKAVDALYAELLHQLQPIDGGKAGVIFSYNEIGLQLILLDVGLLNAATPKPGCDVAIVLFNWRELIGVVAHGTNPESWWIGHIAHKRDSEALAQVIVASPLAEFMQPGEEQTIDRSIANQNN